MKIHGLKSLEQHNWLVARERNSAKPKHNGIACPECGHALYDTGMKLLLDPPLYKMACTNEECDYTGNRK